MHVLTCAPAGVRPSTLRVGDDAIDWAEELGPRNFLLADATVLDLHGERIPTAGEAGRLALEGGEQIKSMATLDDVLRHMARLDLDRSARLVALGGGTIGDLGALCASMYKRGIELVQIPTTLLAMCDSSVGGKSAVNLPEGKNLVGHMWPAVRVLIDPRFLATLSDDEFTSGLGEVLKVAIGLDAALFELLESRRDAVMAREAGAMEDLILHTVRAKIRVVEDDPHESGPRRLLNLGHTLGHALEAQSEWTLKHGHAVARGLHFALDVAVVRDVLAPSTAARCRALLEAYGFGATALPSHGDLRAYMARDKKVEGDDLHMVLPCGVGESLTVAIPFDELCAQLG